jgi:NTP pyrophosphatase (non-canonical NTP hydrolase)
MKRSIPEMDAARAKREPSGVATARAESSADDLRDLKELAQRLRDFARERDWKKFHTPKNLAMALAVEVAELMEHFQWLGSRASAKLDEKTLAQVREEVGDVLIYLVRLADRLGIDPLTAAAEKIRINQRKYPADRVRGKAKKYTEY